MPSSTITAMCRTGCSHRIPELSCGPAIAGNLLVQGDNLDALKALLPYYAGKVKCIYIDPPYNTGNENWVYNDNVNSPEIRRWLVTRSMPGWYTTIRADDPCCWTGARNDEQATDRTGA